VTYLHQMLGAALIHPNRREVIALMPEPIVKQDGSEKNQILPDLVVKSHTTDIADVILMSL